MKLKRALADQVIRASREVPVVTIVGPRQAGKTTLARMTFPDKAYRSLENPDDRAFAVDDPRGFLASVADGAILDEIQRAPHLLSYLQGMVDDRPEPGRFILTGSQHFLLMQNVSQSLAGRTAILTLLPLSLPEIQDLPDRPEPDTLMQRGFFPRQYERTMDAYALHRDYFQTYVERDVRLLLNVHNLHVFETFVRLCAGRVGQLLNITSLANDAGVSPTTAKEWISLLEASFILFRLPPWHANIGKRLIKTPKLYFYDVGLAAYLCGVEEPRQLATHPLRGHLFENMLVAELCKHRYNRGRDNRLCFYRDHTGNEVDVLVPHGPDWIPVEIKAGQTVRSEWFAGIEHFARVRGAPNAGGIVLYGGDEVQRRSAGVACGLWSLGDVLTGWPECR
jgi:predicted AAA+ superfamily ATPase